MEPPWPAQRRKTVLAHGPVRLERSYRARFQAGRFDLDVHCAINGGMSSITARLYFWFYGYPKPTAAARTRSF
jgi:hypothetical protein